MFRNSSSSAKMYEYGSAVDVKLSIQPVKIFENFCKETNIIDLDLSKELGVKFKATSPNLLASFVTINKDDTINTEVNSTSQLFYVIKGCGKSKLLFSEEEFMWKEGDLFVVPSFEIIRHSAYDYTSLYWVNDQPLMEYMGVISQVKKFKFAHFTKEELYKNVEIICEKEDSKHNNRLGVLLGNIETDSYTKTLTPTLWGLLNKLPAKSKQRPHRHNSVALDLCIYASDENVYTLMGKELDEDGWVKYPVKCIWKSGSVFTTPPGWWHSHHNDSDEDAWVLPIQDAGLLTHQRILGIEFSECKNNI